MLNPMIIQGTLAMARRKTLHLIRQVTDSIFKSYILVKLDHVRVLTATVGIMTSKAGGPILSASSSLYIQRMISEAFVGEDTGPGMASITKRVRLQTFLTLIFQLVVPDQ